METQAFYTLMQRNSIAMIAAGEVTKPAHDDTPRRGRNGAKLYLEEKKVAREAWAKHRHRMLRSEACRLVADIVREKTGNEEVTFTKVLSWARRGELDVVLA